MYQGVITMKSFSQFRQVCLLFALLPSAAFAGELDNDKITSVLRGLITLLTSAEV